MSLNSAPPALLSISKQTVSMAFIIPVPNLANCNNPLVWHLKVLCSFATSLRSSLACLSYETYNSELFFAHWLLIILISFEASSVIILSLFFFLCCFTLALVSSFSLWDKTFVSLRSFIFCFYLFLEALFFSNLR